MPDPQIWALAKAIYDASHANGPVWSELTRPEHDAWYERARPVHVHLDMAQWELRRVLPER